MDHTENRIDEIDMIIRCQGGILSPLLPKTEYIGLGMLKTGKWN